MEQILVLNRVNVGYSIPFEITKHIAKIVMKVGLFGYIGFITYNSIQINHQSQMIPIRIESKQSIDMIRTKKALIYLNAPTNKIDILSESIVHGASIVKVDPVLIAVLMSTESNFKPNAKSSMDYRGLMQTRTSTGLPATDTMHGCETLREKLQIANNDITTALTYYKGSNYLVKNKKKSKGYQQALEVLANYKKTLNNIQMV